MNGKHDNDACRVHNENVSCDIANFVFLMSTNKRIH